MAPCNTLLFPSALQSSTVEQTKLATSWWTWWSIQQLHSLLEVCHAYSLLFCIQVARKVNLSDLAVNKEEEEVLGLSIITESKRSHLWMTAYSKFRVPYGPHHLRAPCQWGPQRSESAVSVSEYLFLPTAIPGGPPSSPPTKAVPPATIAPLVEFFTATLIWSWADISQHRRMTSSNCGAIPALRHWHDRKEDSQVYCGVLPKK